MGFLSAGLSVLGSVIGGNAAAGAAKNAGRESLRGYNQASGAVNQGTTNAAEMLQGWSDRGAGAANLISGALGVTSGQGGITQSGVVSDAKAYEQILKANPQVAGTGKSLTEWIQYETAHKKSPLYGMSPEQATKWFTQNYNTGRQMLAQAQTQAAAGPTTPAQTPAEAQAAANQVFQGSQYAQNANQGTALANTYAQNLQTGAQNLNNALWQPVGGVQATYDQSPWQDMSNRATDRANDLFLGLAGGSGSVLSGRTARGLQENQAYIDDAFHGDYLNAYNNAATTGYNATSGAQTGGYNAQVGALQGQNNAFTQWMNGLSGVSNQGYGADQAAAGQQVNAGNALAGLATGNANNQANSQLSQGAAQQNMIGGVFNGLGQMAESAVSAIAGVPGGGNIDPSSINVLPNNRQQTTNSLYMPQQTAPVRLRSMGMG